MIHRIFFGLALLLLGSGVSQAADKSKVVTYPVLGTSAKAIYDSIKKTSPRIARNPTFSFTTIGTKTDKATKKGKDSCSYSRFRTSAYYIFTLPRLASRKGVPEGLSSSWSSFAGYLKTHEQGHRPIWRACFAEYDAGALKLEAKNCDALDKKREKFFTTIKRRCLKKDEDFDFGFRKEVLKQAFVKEALAKK